MKRAGREKERERERERDRETQKEKVNHNFSSHIFEAGGFLLALL